MCRCENAIWEDTIEKDTIEGNTKGSMVEGEEGSWGNKRTPGESGGLKPYGSDIPEIDQR